LAEAEQLGKLRTETSWFRAVVVFIVDDHFIGHFDNFCIISFLGCDELNYG